MYLIEIKVGGYKIRKYVSSGVLAKLMQYSKGNCDYIKIIEEIPDKPNKRGR